MALIPNTFPEPPQPIASFNFTDIADGSGNVLFLGLATEDTGGVGYHLVSTTTPSTPIVTGRSSQGTTTIDFDSTVFNLPRTAKGTATFSAYMGATVGEDVKLAVTIIHVDADDNETVIGTELTSATYTSQSGTEAEAVSLRFVLTEKRFKRGDKIRLRVKLTQVNAAGASEVGHDPGEEDGTFIQSSQGTTTKMELIMPFRIPI